MCPNTSTAMARIGTSTPSIPKLWTFGLTGVPFPLGAIVIKPRKGQTEPARPHPMAVEANNVLVVLSQANPLTVKPTGPIVLMRLPVFGSSITSVLFWVHGPPGNLFSQSRSVPTRLGCCPGGTNAVDVDAVDVDVVDVVKVCAGACWANVAENTAAVASSSNR